MDGGYSAFDRNVVLVATFLGVFINPLLSTMLNLSLISIGSDFGVGSHDMGYITAVFLLGSLVCMVPAGRASEIYGMKRIFLIGAVIVAVSAVLSVFSPTFWFFIAMRAIIGAGSAMMVVPAVALLTCVFPKNKRGWAIGINTTAVYLGLSLGPPLGGVISDTLGWRAIFITVALMTLVTIAAMSMFRKEVATASDVPMDVRGAVMWAVMIAVLMFGLMNVDEVWGAAMTAVGAVLLVATVSYLRKADNPVMDIRLFSDCVFRRSCISTFMNYGASASVSFFLALYLQSIGEMTATEAGLFMLIQPFMQVLLTARMGALSDRMSDKRVLPAIGMALMCIGLSMYLFVGTDFSLPYVAAMMVVVGVAMGIFSSPNASVILSSAPDNERGSASGIVSVARQSGMVVSLAIAMVVISVVMGSTDNLVPAAYGDFVSVIHISFAIFLCMCVYGTMCVVRAVRSA